MRITGIRAWRVELPLHEGRYSWSNGNFVDVFDSTVVAIDTETGEAVLEEEDEVATVPAAGIEHTTPAIEVSPCELVEEVDVDVAECGPQLDAGGCHKGLAVAGGPSAACLLSSR